MNFKKVNDLKLELDKNQSEILLENRINDLFDFVDLESEMVIEYYNQVITPYLISLNLNPNEYCGYSLHFYYDDNGQISLYRDNEYEDAQVQIKFYSEIWKQTNQFFNNKKYKKVIENIYTSLRSLKFEDISNGKSVFINVNSQYHFSFLMQKNQNLWKNYLINKKIQYFINSGIFQYLLNIKNQEYFYLSNISIYKIIEIYYKKKFVLKFSYQVAKNKREIIDMFLDLKRKIEYQINVKKRKRF